MNALQIIGLATITILLIVLILKIFRYYVPKKYNYRNCPNDHDTMARNGALTCNKCGNSL